MKYTEKGIHEREEIFKDLANNLKELANKDLVVSKGIICAYTLKDRDGKDLIELQTDYQDHFDLIFIINEHPYSLGGAYVHGLKNWIILKNEATICLKIFFHQKKAIEEEWTKAGKRVGGKLHIPTIDDPDKFILIDRTGTQIGWFSKAEYITHIFDF